MTHRIASDASSPQGPADDPGPEGCQSWNGLVQGVALGILRSRSLPELLQSSVDAVHRLLGCDRVLIYQFDADWRGQVVAEALSAPRWSVIHRVVHDPCFEASWIKPYQEKHCFAMADIATANLSPCHASFLASFQVRANLVIPILQEDTLWGLLIAHHCQSPRPWQTIEIEGLQHLALEMGLAIRQATLIEQLQAAKRTLEGEVAARIQELEQANQALQTANQKLVEEIRERRMVEIERLQAQTQLQQMSAIVASSQDAIIGKTLQGTITSWNKAAEDIFGYTADEIIGQPITTIIPPDHPDEALEILKRIRQGQRVDTFETQRLHKNGQQVEVSLTVSPIYDENGNVIGASKIARDITAHQQAKRLRQTAESALRDSQQQFELFMRYAPALTWITDIHGIAQYANARWLDFVGQTAESALGQPIAALFSPEVAQELRQNNQQVIETNTILETTESVPNQDGDIHTFLICKFPIHQDQAIIAVGGIGIDITERSRAEAALKDSEARWQFALEGAGDGLWDWDIETNHVFFSRQWKAMLGYEEHEISHRLEEWSNRLHPDDKAQCYDDLDRHLKGETDICQSEYRLRDKNGHYKWMLDRGKVIEWDDQGHPRRMIGTHTDISDRKEAEAKLQEREQEYRLLIENLPAGLVVHGPNSEVIANNTRATELLGLTTEQMQGKTAIDPAWSFLEEDGITPMPLEQYPISQVLAAGEPVQNQVIGVRHPGGHRIVWVLANAYPLFKPDHRLDRVIVTFVDITDQKEAQFALMASEQRYAALADTAPVGIFRADLAGNSIFYNRSWCELSGFTMEESLGQGWVKAIHPDDAEAVWLAWQQTIDQEQMFQCEHRLLRPDGQVVWVVVQAQLERNPAGEVIGYVGVLTDITGRKQAENDLKATKEQLELVLQASSEGFWDWDLVTNDIYFSPRWKEMLGYADHELENILEVWSSVIFEEDYDSVFQLTHNDANDLADRFSSVQRFHHKNGSTVYILSRAINVHDDQGQTVRMVGSHLDITSTIDIQEALKNSEMQLSSILNSSLDGIMAFRSVRDEHDKIVDFEWLLSNPTACQTVNKSADELIGHRLLEVLPGQRADGSFDLYVQVVTTGTPIQRQFHYQQDGIDSWFEHIAVPLDDGFVVTFRDISALKASEQALQDANTALETNVKNLHQRNDEMTMLSETSDFLQACRTIEEACAVISTLVQPLFPNCSGSFYITCASRNRLEAVAKWGDTTHLRDDLQPHECWGLRRGRLHHIPPEQPGLRCNHIMTDALTLTSLCIPMIAQGETLGLFYLGTDHPEALNQPKQHLARTVAEQVGLAIANLHLRETLQNQSIRDSLTGLFNRRYLEEALDTELVRAQRHRYPTAVVMIDVDHFKSFNDQYGHEAGDLVLREIAKVLRDSLRGSDIACRYGGEELLLILPETSLPDALLKAEELRAAIRHISATYSGHSISQLTASFGVSVFPDHGHTQARVIQAADAALYRAKTAGRDRVMSAEKHDESSP